MRISSCSGDPSRKDDVMWLAESGVAVDTRENKVLNLRASLCAYAAILGTQTLCRISRAESGWTASAHTSQLFPPFTSSFVISMEMTTTGFACSLTFLFSLFSGVVVVVVVSR